MENTSFWNTTTSSSSDDDHDNHDDHDDDDEHNHLAPIRHVSLKVIYILIGSVGLVDNIFVLIVFIFFINITAKVFQYRTGFRVWLNKRKIAVCLHLGKIVKFVQVVQKVVDVGKLEHIKAVSKPWKLLK